MQNLTKAFFAEKLNAVFTPQLTVEEPYPLELTDIKEYVGTPGFEQFSLIFQGSLALLLPQNTYSLTCEGTEPFLIFLVPVGVSADRSAYLYEAVFNRKVKED